MTGLASSFRSVPDLWHHRVGSTPDGEAMRFREDGRWRSMSWAEAGTRVRALANGLLGAGLQPEDRCVVFSGTCVEWILADLAILCAGGATTTIYPAASDAELEYILRDSGAVVAFVEGPVQVERLAALRARLPDLRRVVAFRGPGSPDGWVAPLAAFERDGGRFGAADPEAYTKAHRAVDGERMATLMYTSGTTGQPKGVMLSHDAWVYEAEAIDALGMMHPADVQLLWLPLAHVFAKVLQLSFIRLGIPTVVDGSVEDLVANLKATQPTWFAGVPRTFEKAQEAIVAAARSRGRVGWRTWRWAMAVGTEALRLREEGRSPGPLLRARLALADRLVFREVRERFGGRIRFMISGGAPLPREVGEFFGAIGVTILEGYGLTETAAASCVNRLEDVRYGTVGPPLPGCEVRIDDDGEILLRSRGLMKGYWKLPEDTIEAFTPDGFFRTGDIGLLLPSGHLRITGRKKEILVTAGGKNVAPAHFESLLRTRCPYVSQVVMCGDRRPYCSALVTLDPVAAPRWAFEHQVPFADLADLGQRPELRDVIQGYVDAINRDLPPYEQVRRFTILPEDFTLVNGLLTPSLKVKRQAVVARFADRIEAMYEGRRQATPVPAARVR